jgi:hypothetical protein
LDDISSELIDKVIAINNPQEPLIAFFPSFEFYPLYHFFREKIKDKSLAPREI